MVFNFTLSLSCLCSIYKSLRFVVCFFTVLFWRVIAHDVLGVALMIHMAHTCVLSMRKHCMTVSTSLWDASCVHVRKQSEWQRQFRLRSVCDDCPEGEAGGSHVRKQVAAVCQDVARVGRAAVSFRLEV